MTPNPTSASRSSSLLRCALAGVLCVWIVGVVALYYVTWGAGLRLSLRALDSVYSVVYAVLVFSSSLLLGRGIAYLTKLPGESRDPVTQVALGVSAWIYFVIMLGACKLLYGSVIVVALLLVHLCSLKLLVPAIMSARGSLRSRWSRPIRPQVLLPWVLPGCLLCFAAVQTFAPPVGPDDLIHHLNGPMRRLQSHSLAFSDETRSLAGMQNAAALYSVCLAGPTGDGPAKLVNFGLLLLLVATLRAIVVSHFPRVSTAWVALLVLSQPVVHYVSVRPYADLLLTWMVTLGLLHALSYVRDPRRSSLWLAGVFLGVALGTRLTAAQALAGVSVALCGVSLARGRGLRSALLSSGVLCLLATLAALPWLAWNWYYLGSPVFPLLTTFFSPQHAKPLADSFFADMNASLVWAHDLLGTLALPWTITFALEPPNGEWGSIPLPSLLGLLPLVLGSRQRAWQDWFLLIFASVYFLCWARNMNFQRYLIPEMPAYAILCIVAIQRLRSQFQGPLGRALAPAAVAALVALPAAVELLEIAADPANSRALNYAVGALSRDQYYDRAPFRAVFQMSMYCNRTLDPTKSRLRLFGEAQTYYIEVPHVPDGLSHGELYDYAVQAEWNTGTLRELLQQRGITHILFNPGTYQYLFLRPNAIYGRSPVIRAKAAQSVAFFERFAREQLQLLHVEQPLALYTWAPSHQAQ